MRKILQLLRLFLVCFSVLLMVHTDFQLRAQTTVTIYPNTASMNTGYVQSNGSKFNGDMQVSTSTTYGCGWAKFPLSAIPSNATINSVTIEFYTYAGNSSSVANTIRGFTGDPVTMTGSTLYNAIGTGTSYNSSTWTIGTTSSPSLNSRSLTAAAFVQSQLGTGYVNFGFVRGSSNLHAIYGTPNSTYCVRLIVNYGQNSPL